ncbi:hypothetical protein G6F22_021691 [Rhizopus arrhizus]|uniref:Uncharacterized protein n=1 Tax=Rhizopus oryzae TaxID=64495 RepID=A0A9P6WRD2_RHIOR|nr:hypothetical protein G6F22_021691 [Rhizopus arrhizus]KAG1242535.1 hypothetical protein G6F65_022969 [Rhizopus arrhizus]KAG1272807.1 hypothetical protein G6F64_015462 [Rhizopus arrhizus]
MPMQASSAASWPARDAPTSQACHGAFSRNRFASDSRARASSTAIAMPWKSEACSAMDNPATLSAKVL